MIELCKSYAAKKAIEVNIQKDLTIGIGSGSTMRYVLESLKEKCNSMNISVRCVPTSFQSKQLIHEYGLPISDLDVSPSLDLCIDGADEVDSDCVAIKGGGACLAQEKVIAFAAKRFIVVADYRKNSRKLGENWSQGIPIEVLPMACNSVRHHISKEFQLNMAEIPLRIGREKAGPVVTDNGNFVIDWKFNPCHNRSFNDWKELSDKIKLIPGVLETGIFAGMIDEAYFGQEDGSVLIRKSKEQHLRVR